MSFSLVATLSMVLSMVFGLAGLIAPEKLLALYGITGWNEGTLFIARMWGVLFIFLSANLAAVRTATDQHLQSRFSIYAAVSNALAAVVVVHAIVTGCGNNLLWSSVALFVFFMVAFGKVGLRR